MNDPELRGYYNEDGLPELDVQDKRKRYDTQNTNDKKRNDRRRYKTKAR